jgi:hypothetical protein
MRVVVARMIPRRVRKLRSLLDRREPTATLKASRIEAEPRISYSDGGR